MGQCYKTRQTWCGIATEIGYSVPVGSLDFWLKRFEEHNVIYNKPAEKFGQKYLTFLDPDGLKLEMVEVADDKRKPYVTDEVTETVATRGFFNTTLTLNNCRSNSTYTYRSFWL
jgi:glyoxalase family protein